MLSFGRSKKFANIVIDDYAIRIAESFGPQLANIRQLRERPIPAGLIEQGKIVDEIKFYDFMKLLVREWRLKHYNLRFYVPDSLVIMRHVDFPAHLKDDEINEYFALEVGQSLHLPFQNPVIDVHPIPVDQTKPLTNQENRRGAFFAAPEEEVRKFTDLFDDVSLDPKVVGVRSLGIYRYFHHLDFNNKQDVYLFVEFNLLSLNVSIFHLHQLEFTRYQRLDIEPNDWGYSSKDDDLFQWNYLGDDFFMEEVIETQINELERIMDFYRYSLYKGEKSITHLVVTGDHPQTADLKRKLENRYGLPTTLLKAYASESKEKEVAQRFVPALGLALREDNK